MKAFQTFVYQPEVCEKIYEATGGWPILLDRLLSSAANENNLTSPALEFKEKLLEDGSEIKRSFINAISIGGLKATPQVSKCFARKKRFRKT